MTTTANRSDTYATEATLPAARFLPMDFIIPIFSTNVRLPTMSG